MAKLAVEIIVAFVHGKTSIACQKDRTPSNARLIGVSFIIFILASIGQFTEEKKKTTWTKM